MHMADRVHRHMPYHHTAGCVVVQHMAKHTVCNANHIINMYTSLVYNIV